MRVPLTLPITPYPDPPNRHGPLSPGWPFSRSLPRARMSFVETESRDHAVMRVFRARPHAGAGSSLVQLLLTNSVDLVRHKDGFIGHIAAGPVDGWYTFITFWRDESAVRAFAGESWRESVLPDGYAGLLQEHDVEHSTVLDMGMTVSAQAGS